MEDLKTNTNLFKKLDTAIFQQLDKFKQTANYAPIQDFYNGLEEEQQKLFKVGVLFITLMLPISVVGILWSQNQNLKADLEMRKEMISKGAGILADMKSLEQISPQVFSASVIDNNSLLSSKVSQIMQSQGLELSKLMVSNFQSENVSSTLLKAEADFKFNDLSTDELMNVFSAMMSREKFKISDVNIKKNLLTNKLEGTFHALHFSIISAATSGDEE